MTSHFWIVTSSRFLPVCISESLPTLFSLFTSSSLLLLSPLHLPFSQLNLALSSQRSSCFLILSLQSLILSSQWQSAASKQLHQPTSWKWINRRFLFLPLLRFSLLLHLSLTLSFSPVFKFTLYSLMDLCGYAVYICYWKPITQSIN